MQQFGYDLLASVKYQNKALRGVRRDSVIAVLDRYFEPRATPHDIWYERILKSRKNLSLLVHSQWSNSHKFSKDQEKKALRAAKRINKLSLNYANKNIYFSPFLEHKESTTRMTRLFTKLQKIAPNLILVNSFIKGGALMNIKSVINEIHHEDWDGPVLNTEYLFSTDGYDFLSLNSPIKAWKEKYKSAQQFRAWIPSFNGKNSIDDKTPPLMRKHFPTIIEIKQCYRAYKNV